ncbi:MAG: rRNA pseudouridine synthase, partial [Clostridia bacterium]|nr:rRNA pseudouridine synthase [Clostridia bacterium]
MMMRLDKFFSETGKLTRSQCAAAAKKGLVTVNGEVVKKTDFKIDPYKDEIALSGEVVTYSEFVYIVMNKPDGVVSATEDGRDKTLIDLLPIEIARLSPFPCGRLDKDTVGLVIITNDGVAAHNALSPKRHVEKKYYYECADPLSEKEAEKIRAGVFL